ncbi:ABC transporter ATP-binding protein [Anoxybacteroides rupiense]|uniref:ABC transporter ATP-binding protein n=1 Tax=Anoxybacteroides rupiense TaxID=311460 RepID=UPI0016056809|nr:ABC transporter ATP-binding protein [Anoxybacillus rupiensis]MBB3908967.1 ABC-type bacteriocin/lantibiotic exporter with double-glycine peptidase domain [Anoxybacillus rupiensis]
MSNSAKLLFSYLKDFKKNLSIAFLLLVVLSAITVLPGLIIKNIFDFGIAKKDYHYVLIFSAILAFVYVSKSMLNYFSNVVFTKVSQNIVLNIRQNISTRLLKLPMEFFHFYPSGYITSRLNEVNHIGGLFSANTFKILLSFFELVATFIILTTINSKLTFILCLLMPVYYIISNKFLSSIFHISTETAEKSAVLNNKIQQSVQGIEEVKNLSVEDKETEKIHSAAKDLVAANIKQSIFYSIGMELIVLVGSLSSVLLIVMGGKDVILNNMTIGGYMVFMNYLPRLYSPIQNISATVLTIQPALVSLKRLHIFMEQIGEDEEQNKVKINDIKSIEFKGVSFRYKEDQPYILNNVSFSLAPSDNLLIKGKNGTGKTTILRILMVLYNVQKGQVLINGIPIHDIDKKSLRKNIGIVSQKIYLFNDTIENNIKYGVENVDSNTYMEVLRATGLDDMIEKLPDKEKTLVGENGKNLSGGQIQRIAIARALLKGATIIMFDEAISHMDFSGKEKIKKLIENGSSHSIFIIIDHGNDFESVCNKIIHLHAHSQGEAIMATN